MCCLPSEYFMHFRSKSRVICKEWKTFQILKIYITEKSRKIVEIIRLMDIRTFNLLLFNEF
jgi:hypothetical protein